MSSFAVRIGRLATHVALASVPVAVAIHAHRRVNADVAVCERARNATAPNVIATIGNTPLLELKSLSRATGCRILAKAEHMNPGGSVKDRPAARIIEELELEGRLVPADKLAPGEEPCTIVEGTGGNTGIGMAVVAAARGYKCVFTMPANIAVEKIEFMRTLGAEAVVCPVVPFTSPEHYYHKARTIAEQRPRCVWGNQFENTANMRAHRDGTAPEIWRQAGERVDCIVAAAGTGGTIAGLSTFLKEKNPSLQVFVIDPPGSSLFNYVTKHELTPTPGSTITEGIGIGRITANFAAARVDGAFQGVDQEAVDMAWFLLRQEGILIGPSAALNVTGAVKAARRLGPGHTVVTVLCDGGERYKSKLFNMSWLTEKQLLPADVPRGGIPHVS